MDERKNMQVQYLNRIERRVAKLNEQLIEGLKKCFI